MKTKKNIHANHQKGLKSIVFVVGNIVFGPKLEIFLNYFNVMYVISKKGRTSEAFLWAALETLYIVKAFLIENVLKEKVNK